MAPRNQVVGIIEIDADPVWDATFDESFGETLRCLRHHSSDSPPDCDTDWDASDEPFQDAVVVLRADLHQLRHELHLELAGFLQRLLTTY